MNTHRKNRGGCPPKKASERRNYRINLRLSTEEYYALKARVRAANLPLSAWVRQALAEAKITPRLSPEQTELLRQAAALGNNLNQLAKRAHSAGYDTVRAECEALLAELRAVLNSARR